MAGFLPDPFDGAALQAGWLGTAPLTGTTLPTVGGGVASGFATSALWGEDFDSGSNPYVEFIIPTAPADFDYVGALFLNTVGGNGYTLYYKREPGAQDQIVFEEVVSGAGTGTIGNQFFNDVSFPLTFRATYDPTTDTFTVRINGVDQPTTYTDSTYTALLRPGFFLLGGTITQFDAGPMPSGVILPAIDYSKHPKLTLLGAR